MAQRPRRLYAEKYKKHFKSGGLGNVGQSVEIKDPNKLSGIDQLTLAKEIDDIGKLKFQKQTRKPKDNSPPMDQLISGAMGLLDCCHDRECKGSLALMGINLRPVAAPAKAGRSWR